jgi:hypothetical protein
VANVAVRRVKIDITLSSEMKEKIFKVMFYVNVLKESNIKTPDKTRNQASAGKVIEFLLDNGKAIDEYLTELIEEYSRQEQ